MTVTFDISTDFESVADGLETVTYAPRHPTPENAGDSPTRTAGRYENYTPDTQSLTKCLRRAVSHTEVAASNGYLMAGDTRWHLSANELANRPPLGSTLTDSDGAVFTILEVRRDSLDSRWRCVCRDLRVVHNLSDLVNVEYRTITKGTSGAAEETWATFKANIPARIQETGSENVVEGGVRRTRKTYQVYLTQDVDLTHNHRLKDVAGNYYQIEGDADRDSLAFMQVLSCREGKWA